MSVMQVKRVVETVREFPGLGGRIKAAREADPRSLVKICKEAGISRPYWYQLESGDLRAPATEAIIRKIEKVLGKDFGVKFDE